MSIKKKISQETLDEALCPELSEDYFILNDHKITISAMKIKYQKQFAKAFTPIIDDLAVSLVGAGNLTDLSITDILTCTSKLLNNIDVFSELLRILAWNSGYEATQQEIDDSTIEFTELRDVLVKAWRKGGEFNREIADFIETALKQGRAALKKDLEKMKNPEGNSTTIAS